jgi:hypothetical protein
MRKNAKTAKLPLCEIDHSNTNPDYWDASHKLNMKTSNPEKTQ